MDLLNKTPSIAILDSQIAAKIAAGEVIERPSAVVRELLDNAIDAGASDISLYLEMGGLQLIRVRDNGLGMSREDLELCYLPHATSKIRHTDDLLKLNSLGFRGEALGSIAACSKMRIRSAQEISGQLHAYELRVADNLFEGLEHSSVAHSGTQVEVRELFYSFPARRKFLKSNRAELVSCKSVFQEKTLAFPEIHFRLYNHDKMELSLASGSKKERLSQIFGELEPDQLFVLSEEMEHFSFQLFVAAPAIYRRDRKRMPVYINQRPIMESALQQAIRMGFDGYLAGGLFPICFCFVEVDPQRVDFNIHPAKREARLRDLNLIQAGIRQTLRRFCREYGKLSMDSPADEPAHNQTQDSDRQTNKKDFIAGAATDSDEKRIMNSSSARSHTYWHNGLGSVDSTDNAQRDSHQTFRGQSGAVGPGISARNLVDYSITDAKDFGTESVRDSLGLPLAERPLELPIAEKLSRKFSAEFSSSSKSSTWEKKENGQEIFSAESQFRYLGQLFEVFLLVERCLNGISQLLIVDQHASHERILYETLEQEMLCKQPLLVPIELESAESELSLESQNKSGGFLELLRQRSVALAEIGIQLEEPDHSSNFWRITSLPPSVSEIKEEVIELVLHGAGEVEDLKRELFAHLSCRKAIKKGDILDEITAVQLLSDLFSRGLERCPHGRPLWFSLSRPELYRLLQRT